MALRALAGEIVDQTPSALGPWLTRHSNDGATHHSLRVAVIAVSLGRTLGLSEGYLQAVALGGLLHDFGLSLMPDHTPTPRVSADLATTHDPLPALAHEAILHHRERFDGLGQPYGLSGDDIPLPGRLVGLANLLDAAMIGQGIEFTAFEDDGACDPQLMQALQGLAQRV